MSILVCGEANMVFYGPSDTGKTTIANIVAERTHKALYRLNATTASLQDVKDIIADVGTLLAPGGVLLYLDEIQYFNKKQQQSLLEFMENGKLTLIASTTENPYFYVYGALLSRAAGPPLRPRFWGGSHPPGGAAWRSLLFSSYGKGLYHHHGESLFLCLRGPSQPEHGFRVQGRAAGGGGARRPPGAGD